MGLYDDGPSPTTASIIIALGLCASLVSCGYQFVQVQDRQTRAEEIRAAALLCRTEDICLPVYQMIGVKDENKKGK